MMKAFLRQKLEGLKFLPLEGIPDPDGIVPKKRQEKALRLIPIYNDKDKRFWISFWIGLLSPVMVVIAIVLYCQIFKPKEVLFSIHFDGANELIFWPIFMIAVGYLANGAFEYYCRNLFYTIDVFYFKKTGKTGKEIEESILKEVKEESTIDHLKAKIGEFNRQKYKAYVCYAFYGLVIPTRPRRYVKVHTED
jgi:hypothetical protein